MDPSKPLQRRPIVLPVAALGLAALAIIYGRKLNYPPIRSDGVGYYLYLPAAFIDRDVSLRTAAARNDGTVQDWTGVSRVASTNRLLIKYTLGEAILLAPFFLLAHGLTLATGVGKADGFSVIYQAAAAIAGLVYLLLGLHVLRNLLEKSFSPPVVWWTLVSMVFGTNLFHYGTYDSIFSHTFSFFLFTVFLYCVERWYAHASLPSTVALAAVAGLITLVRPTNSIVFLYALLFDVHDRGTLLGRVSWLRRNGRLVLAGVLVYTCVLSPQLAYWKFITGHWIIFSYVGESFHFFRAAIGNVLFSVRKGLFLWSPIMVLAVVGFFFMKNYKRAYVLPTLLFMPLNLYIIASWYEWAYGGSFGHRAFVESICVFAFGYASLVQSLFDAGRRRGIVIVSLVLMLYSTHWMVKYWLGIIPFDRTTWPQFVSAFWRW